MRKVGGGFDNGSFKTMLWGERELRCDFITGGSAHKDLLTKAAFLLHSTGEAAHSTGAQITLHFDCGEKFDVYLGELGQYGQCQGYLEVIQFGPNFQGFLLSSQSDGGGRQNEWLYAFSLKTSKKGFVRKTLFDLEREVGNCAANSGPCFLKDLKLTTSTAVSNQLFDLKLEETTEHRMENTKFTTTTCRKVKADNNRTYHLSVEKC